MPFPLLYTQRVRSLLPRLGCCFVHHVIPPNGWFLRANARSTYKPENDLVTAVTTLRDRVQ